MRKWQMLLLALVSMIGASSLVNQGNAAPSLESFITSDGTILEGDKLFSNFSFSVGPGNPGDVVSPTAASGITVQGTVLGGDAGLLFTGPFTASGIGPLGFPNSALYVIQFDVTVEGASLVLSDLHQSISGVFTQPAFASLFSFATDPTNPIINIGDASSSLNSGNISASDSGTLAFLTSNRTTMHVVEDLQISSGGAAGSLAIPRYTVAFSQTCISPGPCGPVSVPEPSSLVLFGTALVGLRFVRRRNRSSKPAEDGTQDRRHLSR